MVFSNLKQNTTNKFLTVNQLGQVILEKPRTQLSSPEEWSDKVFEANYQLKSLSDLEQFVKENKHLPNIPSAKEMTDKGIESDKLASKLLEKIEELTLYLIEMKKENQALKERVNVLEKK
jgi:trimeric autotransporter adhesin